jgi:hypothetical protein
MAEEAWQPDGLRLLAEVLAQNPAPADWRDDILGLLDNVSFKANYLEIVWFAVCCSHCVHLQRGCD